MSDKIMSSTEPGVRFDTWQQLNEQGLSKVTIISLKAELRARNVRFKANSNKRQMYRLLFDRLYSFAHDDLDALDKAVLKITRVYKGWKVRHSLCLHGPAALNVSICNNEVDPITMDDLKDIPRTDLFSFTDIDGKVYGFDVQAFWKWFQAGNEYNPFTRNLMSDQVKARLFDSWQDSCKYAGPAASPAAIVNTQERAFDIFHSIYLLTGNFVDEAWFMDLDRIGLLRMYRCLHDIWICQTDMPHQERLSFSPAHAPIMSQLIDVCFRRLYKFQKLQQVLLSEFELLLKNPQNKQDKCTSALWILVALTMVSRSAAYHLPHLCQTYY